VLVYSVPPREPRRLEVPLPRELLPEDLVALPLLRDLLPEDLVALPLLRDLLPEDLVEDEDRFGAVRELGAREVRELGARDVRELGARDVRELGARDVRELGLAELDRVDLPLVEERVLVPREVLAPELVRLLVLVPRLELVLVPLLGTALEPLLELVARVVPRVLEDRVVPLEEDPNVDREVPRADDPSRVTVPRVERVALSFDAAEAELLLTMLRVPSRELPSRPPRVIPRVPRASEVEPPRPIVLPRGPYVPELRAIA
jgi:hypothetical protein